MDLPIHHCPLAVGTPIRVRNEFNARISAFVPQDGYQVGCIVEGLPFEGRIVRQSECVVIDTMQENIYA